MSKIHLFFSVLIVLVLIPTSQAISPPFDSHRQIEVDGKISKGRILISPTQSDPIPLIHSQLKYLLGQLSWFDAMPKITWFKIQIHRIDPPQGGGTLRWVHYTAEGKLSWSREAELPSQIDLAVPAQADASGLTRFARQYLSSCADDANADEESFFYYYFPLMSSCPLRQASSTENPSLVTRFPILLTSSGSNSQGKYPEYGELWKDNQLVITLIHSKNVAGTQSDDDAGIASYNDSYKRLQKLFGKPTEIYPRFSRMPGARVPHIKMKFKTARGEIDVHMDLVDDLTHVNSEFIDRYNHRTLISDLVIYNGHAGLGLNVEALGQMGKYTPGKYQIFMINGCGTYSYLDEDLSLAHARANPGSPVSKHLDVITNTMSNYFSWNGVITSRFLQDIYEQKKTYRQILSKFDPRQRAVVYGEEDNLWPRPFR